MSGEENGQEVIVCRCRDVTEREVKEAIAEGYDTMELLKRKTKIGTGTCGGRTCLPLVQRILARETGREIEEIRLPRERSPIVPMPLRFAAGEKAGDLE
ncbi:MAG: (2Fe-2S)-binding protein [Candidatus Bipolaricaulota bacterium]|nr:(2Fe-2S)-binding protein [Candidatus Bipolaricaulota bacterium]MBS3792437.1 (2Fe-2S)-binding protein [Candidatus Bipolaricaulota bacterium]